MITKAHAALRLKRLLDLLAGRVLNSGRAIGVMIEMLLEARIQMADSDCE